LLPGEGDIPLPEAAAHIGYRLQQKRQDGPDLKEALCAKMPLTGPQLRWYDH
jgi:hypothetical protein